MTYRSMLYAFNQPQSAVRLYLLRCYTPQTMVLGYYVMPGMLTEILKDKGE